MLTKDKADVIAEDLLSQESRARACSRGEWARRVRFFSGFFIAYPVVVIGLVFVTWIFFGRHPTSEWYRPLFVVALAVPCLVRLIHVRRELGRFAGKEHEGPL